MRQLRWTKQNNKLHNKKLVVDGIQFDSVREARRYQELILMLRAGEITDLELQVPYELIPAAFETVETGEIYKQGSKKGQPKLKSICIERAVVYIADFVYKDKQGRMVVEDTKGYRNPSSAEYKVFVLKRKLMLHKHNIKVKEV